jgi:hypothetical protein
MLLLIYKLWYKYELNFLIKSDWDQIKLDICIPYFFIFNIQKKFDRKVDRKKKKKGMD